MAKKKVLVVVGLVCGIVAAMVLAFYRPSGVMVDPVPVIDARGYITDKDTAATDNFKNGKVAVEIQVKSRGIKEEILRSVLDSGTPMQMTISGENKTWLVPTINIRENSGKTEADYGENIECDGVVPGPSGWTDNLYVKITVPTTSGGGVEEGATIRIDMWPTMDAVSAVDNTLSPASFDNVAIDDWWDNKDTINFDIIGKGYSLRLDGFDGAYLIGTEIDE